MSNKLALQYVTYSILDSTLPKKLLILNEYDNLLKEFPKDFDLQEDYELIRMHDMESTIIAVDINNNKSETSMTNESFSDLAHVQSSSLSQFSSNQQQDLSEIQRVRSEMIHNMMSTTSLPAATCQLYLEKSNWDLQKAVNTYFESM